MKLPPFLKPPRVTTRPAASKPKPAAAGPAPSSIKSVRGVHRTDMDVRLHRVTGNARSGVTLITAIGAVAGVMPCIMAVGAVRKAQTPFLAAWIVADMDMANG